MGTSIRYSEAFKRQVVEELDRGKHRTIESARRAYGIQGMLDELEASLGDKPRTWAKAEPTDAAAASRGR